MTNREAIISAIGIPGWQEGTVLKALVDYSISPDVVYVKENSTLVNNAALAVLRAMSALESVSEGAQYAVSYSLAGITARIAALETTLGISSNPKLRNRSNLW